MTEGTQGDNVVTPDTEVAPTFDIVKYVSGRVSPSCSVVRTGPTV